MNIITFWENIFPLEKVPDFMSLVLPPQDIVLLETDIKHGKKLWGALVKKGLGDVSRSALSLVN